MSFSEDVYKIKLIRTRETLFPQVNQYDQITVDSGCARQFVE